MLPCDSREGLGNYKAAAVLNVHYLIKPFCSYATYRWWFDFVLRNVRLHLRVLQVILLGFERFSFLTYILY